MSNRLAQEDSPYLQQHKNNPVDWYPWCDEAFEKAQRENKAIFISIGYSSCHWCHVMEEKVFENEQCAQILNQYFVSIKIDKEERPDLDKHYQSVYQLLNNRAGGWPTSIFATPQNKPFFAATYIPPFSDSSNPQGMGFKELSDLIAQKIAQNDQKVIDAALEVENFMNNKQRPREATILKEEIVKNFMLQVKNNFQIDFGGFSSAPKFPHASTLNALMVVDRLYDDRAAKAMVLTTLDAMKKGGMYDVVEGGFCRYSTDEKWLVPHFEKMLYDNALMCEVYTNAYFLYNNDEYIEIAKECADFWHNYMSENYLMYSASDADMKGEEGSYFVYEYDELYHALKYQNIQNVEKVLASLGVTKDGNFEGKNIINFASQNISHNFDEIKSVLREIRNKREYPFCDKKIQTSWSAMMIKALFNLGQYDAKYTTMAQKYLSALLDALYIDGVLYHTTLIHKKPKIEAFLEDYAFLIAALLNAYKFTQDETYLINAQRFVNKSLEKFFEKGSWSFSVGEVHTEAEIYDNIYTSTIGVMIESLLTIGTLLEEENYTHFAFKTLEYNSYNLARRPVHSPFMLTQMLRYLKGDRVIKSQIEKFQSQSNKLASINFPFILFKTDLNDGYMVCGDKSCFAKSNNFEEVDALVQSSF